MAPFPCPIERTAASALLLLSLSSPKEKNKSERLSLVSSNSNSFSSTLASEGSSEEIRSRRLRITAVVACCQEMKLKVVRKSRSKIDRRSDVQKILSGEPATKSSASVSTETSCSSSSSSSVSSARSRNATSGDRKLAVVLEEPTSVMRRQAEAILKLLSAGCASEVRIRKELGDNPDTSKALRMLLKQKEVKRSGTGGRHDPYIYTIA